MADDKEPKRNGDDGERGDRPEDSPEKKPGKKKRANWTLEECREFGRKGALRSAEVKREKRLFRERAQAILEMDVTPKMRKRMEREIGEAPEGSTVYEAAIAALVHRGAKGDVSAIREIQAIAEKADGTRVRDRPDQTDGLTAALRGLAAGLDAVRQEESGGE